MKSKIKLNKIVTSTKGAAVYILLFVLLPLILILPAIILDLTMLYTAKTHMQNGLDTVAMYAINNSTNDRYRADKILYVMVDNKDKPTNFYAELKEGIEKNFHPVSVNQNGKKYKFTIAGMELIPNEITLTVEAKPAGNASVYNGTSVLSSAAASTAAQYDFQLEMTTDVSLPITGRLIEMFGMVPKNGKKTFSTPITVRTAVRGTRIKKANDFSEWVADPDADPHWYIWEKLP